MKMIVDKIQKDSSDSDEAIVEIFDGKYKCYAFSFPCKLSVGQKITSTLLTLGEGQIIKSQTDEFKLKRVDDFFKHEIVAKIVDKKKSLVRVGELYIEVEGEIPGDLSNGDYIEFTVDRIDVHNNPKSLSLV